MEWVLSCSLMFLLKFRNWVMVGSSGKSTSPRIFNDGRGLASGLPNEAVLMSPGFISSSRRFSEKRKVRDGSPRVPQNFSSCGDDGERGTLCGSVWCSLGLGVGCCLAGIRVLAAFSFLYGRTIKDASALTRW